MAFIEMNKKKVEGDKKKLSRAWVLFSEVVVCEIWNYKAAGSQGDAYVKKIELLSHWH